MPKVSIIIPAFNEEASIKEVIDKIKGLNQDYEIIVVDDASTDKTSLYAKDEGVKLIRHPYNKGYGASLKTGIRNAKGSVIVTMDGDGQHDPQDIERLVSHIGEYDMVVGCRSKTSYEPFLRKPGKKILSLVANFLARQKIPDLNSGLRACKKDILNRYLHLMPEGFSFSTTISILMLKSGYNVKHIPIISSWRIGGRSEVKLFKNGFETLLLIFRLIMLFDPLRVFLPASGFLFGLGILTFLFYKGNITDSTLLFWVVGFLMFFIGLVADQVAAIRREKER